MQQQSNTFNQNMLDFFKNPKKNISKSSLSNEKTLPIKSPVHNNFIDKTIKAKKPQPQLQKFLLIEKLLSKPCETCTFCQSLRHRLKGYLMISSALQIKHTPNLHYHVTKNINDLIQGKRTAKVIAFKDLVMLLDDQEYLKRYYLSHEEPSRLRNLTEFYQYHTEIPKLHIFSLRRILKRYQTNKRKLEYVFVRKLLGFSVNKDIMESSYEPKGNDGDSSTEKEKNRGKALASNILKDISLYKENSFKRVEERTSSITFNEFSQILADKKPETRDLAGMLQRLTENSFELVFKPELVSHKLPSKTETQFNFKRKEQPVAGQHQRLSSNLGPQKSIERVIEQAIEKKRIESKSNTDRNYDFKLKTTRKTINLVTEPGINPQTMLSPKSPSLKVNTDRIQPSKVIPKSTSHSVTKARTSPFSAKNTTKVSFHSKNSVLSSTKNKLILSKKSLEPNNFSNNHFRFFSLNGYDSSTTNRIDSSLKSPKDPRPTMKSVKNSQSKVNFLINKKLVKAHLEEFLLKGPNQALRNSSGSGTCGKLLQSAKKGNGLEALQGKNTQNLFKKIYQNDVTSPKKFKP